MQVKAVSKMQKIVYLKQRSLKAKQNVSNTSVAILCNFQLYFKLFGNLTDNITDNKVKF